MVSAYEILGQAELKANAEAVLALNN